jgi:hypothetical protein
MNRLLIGAGLWLAAASSAVAQGVPNFPQTLGPDTFVGRIQPGSGPSSAVPISALLARIATPNSISNSVLFKAPAATIKGNPTAASANVQDFTIQSLPARGAPDANNDKLLIFDNATGLFKYVTPGQIAAAATSGVSSLDGVVNALTVQSGSLKVIGSQLSSNVLASRAFAITQNLSAFSAVSTLGYGAPGDGGNATFVKLAAGVPFKDTYITTATLVGGSGYVNATYLGAPLGGGTGLGCLGSVTVAGGTVTAVSLAVPCAGYKVGDVLTTPNAFVGGSGSGFSWTVTAISTPQASFTDAVGTNFQFVTDQAGYGNILQFGAKGDWSGTDGSAMNNAAAIWSAAAWASVAVGAASAQVNGNQILFPRGAYMTCGAWNSTIYNIPIPQGVRFSGVGVGGTTLVECAADASGNHYIELCDSNAKVGQLGCKIENMTINLSQVTGSTSGIAAIYSNSGQQFTLGEHLEIDTGGRACIKYEIGKGGAANDIWSDIDCEQPAGTANTAIIFNSSTTQHYLLHSTIGCGGAGGCATAISNSAGRLIVDGLDVEAFVTGLQQNVTVSGNNSVYRNVQQNSNNCTAAIQLVSTNTPGNILFENVATGCPITIQNGQSGGTNFTGNIVKQITCVSGACS